MGSPGVLNRRAPGTIGARRWEMLVDDGAREAWSRAARPVLVQVARRYGKLTAPDDLAEAVQVFSGVRASEDSEQWIGDVLDAVDAECLVRQEPLLSAFCVGADGCVGERYARFVARNEAARVADIEMHAAAQRLDAHRYHGAVLPVDGGQPTLPRQLAAARKSAPKAPPRARTSRAKAAAPARPKKPDPPKRAVCPTCFLQLPISGRCDSCDPD